MSYTKFILTAWLLACMHNVLFAQPLYYHLGKDFTNELSLYLHATGQNAHTSLQPISKGWLSDSKRIDNLIYRAGRDSVFLSKIRYSWFFRKLRTQDFVVVEKKDFTMYANPLINAEFDIKRASGQFFAVNTRGVQIEGTIGSRLAYHTNFYENQAYLVDYLNDYAIERLVVPGQGASKRFKESGHDFAMATGYIAIQANKWLHVQAGHHKHFLGNGYRSLLLSDNAFNMPLLKTELQWRQFRYTAAWSALLDFKYKYYAYHQRKHFTFNYLSYALGNRLEVGLFEGIVWKTSDSTQTLHFSPQFFVPVIGIRALQSGLRNDNFVLMGINARVNITRYALLYGQFAVESLKKRQWAMQGGVKITDVFHGKLKHQQLMLQAEYNYAQPYMYAHNNYLQAYTHYNQPLAHPLGSGFAEKAALMHYRWRDILIDVKMTQATVSADSTGSNFGSNVFMNESSASFDTQGSVGQGVSANIVHRGATVGLLLNPRTFLQVFGGFDDRLYTLEGKSTQQTRYVFVGIRTSLTSHYYDF